MRKSVTTKAKARAVQGKTTRGALNLRNSYNFIDKNPAIDELRTERDRLNLSIRYMAQVSGVCESTLRRWFYKDCRRPQDPTLDMVGRRVFGWTRVWDKSGRK